MVVSLCVTEIESQHLYYNLDDSISVTEFVSQHMYCNLDVSISVTEIVSQHMYCNLDINILLYNSTNPEPILMGLGSLESSRCDDSNEG